MGAPWEQTIKIDVLVHKSYSTSFVGSQISPAILEEFIADIRKTGLKAKTIVEILRVFNQHFRYAVRRHHIRYNPLSDVEKPRLEKPEIDFLRVEEIRKFLAAVPRDWKTSEQLQKDFSYRVAELPEPLRAVVIPHYVQNQSVERISRELSLSKGTVKSRLYRARQTLQFLPSRSDFHGDYVLFLTAILTGMRLGELLGPQWGDIDWEAKKIRILRALWIGKVNGKWQWILQRPKSKAALRDLDTSEDLLKELRRHRLACPKSQHELVFCTQTGDPIEARTLMRWHFIPALERAGLRKIRFHDLRHTYASLLIAQKESPKYIQTQLGHASI
jgi:integrase